MKTISFELPTIENVDFEVECLPEHIDFVGNCSAIDDETDAENEDYIREQLENGNEWAWCTVKVTAKFKDSEGTDYLCGCSYKNQADFTEPGGYYDDMKQSAYNDLISQLEQLAD